MTGYVVAVRYIPSDEIGAVSHTTERILTVWGKPMTQAHAERRANARNRVARMRGFADLNYYAKRA